MTNNNTITAEEEADFAEVPASVDTMLTLGKVIEQAYETSRLIADLEDAIKAAKQELQTLTTKTLPAIMASAKTRSHTTTAGVKIEISEFVNGTLPKTPEAREAAIQWLKDNGGASIIKTELKATLGLGEHNLAGEIRAKFEELGVTFSEDKGVHPQTLAAFGRERLKQGKELPAETLGLSVGSQAKVTLKDGSKISKPDMSNVNRWEARK